MEPKRDERLEVVLAEVIHQQGQAIVTDRVLFEVQVLQLRMLAQRHAQSGNAVLVDVVAAKGHHLELGQPACVQDGAEGLGARRTEVVLAEVDVGDRGLRQALAKRLHACDAEPVALEVD